MTLLKHVTKGWFAGFVSVHPGTEPRGHDVPQWDSRKAYVVSESDVMDTIKALREHINIDEVEQYHVS